MNDLPTLAAEVKALRTELAALRAQFRAQESRLLSKRKAAKRLGISRGPALDFLIETKQLSVVRVGRQVKIAASEVERLCRDGFRRH